MIGSVPVVDADAHVIETDHTWDYLDPEHEKFRPKPSPATDGSRREFWTIDGQFAGLRLPTFTEEELASRSIRSGRLMTSARAAREMDDVEFRLKAMDNLGIDIQILYNTMWIRHLTDSPDIEIALCRSWNRWMANIFGQGHGRLFWTCVVPTLDLPAAIEELRFARAHGAVSLCLRPYEGDRVVTDPYFYPLFEEAEQLEMAISVHIANGSRTLEMLLRGGGSSRTGWPGLASPTVVAAWYLLTSGVTASFPRLRWGVIEASASWVPWLCVEYQRRYGEAGSQEHNPFTEHNFYVAARLGDDLPYIVNHVGESVLMMGTDFGHHDTASEYDALSKVWNMTSLTESAKVKMLSSNPLKFYGLEKEAFVSKTSKLQAPFRQ
jgi:predicted TIM-barrel fold metal-dependent hydrolase